MNYEDIFNRKSILKMSLIALSVIMWTLFYTSSKISFSEIVSLNLPSLVNSFITIDFLMFLILFPLTTAICIAMSIGKSRSLDVLEVLIGMLSGFLIAFILFGFSTNFLLFIAFYILSHLLLSYFSYNKFKEKKKITSLANFATSKISVFLTFSLFIVIFLIILPNQATYSERMKIGLVNLFVGDDVDDWLGTSYSISKSSTVSAVDFIVNSQSYKALYDLQDPIVYNYIDFMEDLRSEVSKKTSKEEIQAIYANLDSLDVKNNILNTISTIPLLIVIDRFFALFYALFFALFSQIYFSIAFSLLGFLYVILFYKVFYKKIEEDD